jgi:hypothetical protein
MAADERRLTRIEVFAHPLPHGRGPEDGRSETCPTLAVNDLRACDFCHGLSAVG